MWLAGAAGGPSPRPRPSTRPGRRTRPAKWEISSESDSVELVSALAAVFRFQTGNHNVLRVSKANYDSCATTNSLEALNTGPATITLSKSGTYYFICGFPGHCSGGQKVALAVGSGTAATPSPATSPAPSARAPAPAASASSPGPSATGAAPSAGGPSAPSASSPAAAPSGKSASAGSRASLGGLVAVLSLAASFFLRM